MEYLLSLPTNAKVAKTLIERLLWRFLLSLYHPSEIFCIKLGGDETRLGYVRYVQGIQPNVPARTIYIDRVPYTLEGSPEDTP